MATITKDDHFSTLCRDFINECALDIISFIGDAGNNKASSTWVDEFMQDLSITIVVSAQVVSDKSASELVTPGIAGKSTWHIEAQQIPT